MSVGYVPSCLFFCKVLLSPFLLYVVVIVVSLPRGPRICTVHGYCAIASCEFQLSADSEGRLWNLPRSLAQAVLLNVNGISSCSTSTGSFTVQPLSSSFVLVGRSEFSHQPMHQKRMRTQDQRTNYISRCDSAQPQWCRSLDTCHPEKVTAHMSRSHVTLTLHSTFLLMFKL